LEPRHSAVARTARS